MKKLLFVIESLTVAGAEKSLVNLLNTLDYTRYSVDLQLFSYGGEFETMLPPEVNLLPPLPYFEHTKKSIGECFRSAHTKQEKRMLLARLRYSLALRRGKFNNPQKAVLFWKHTGRCFETSREEYDAAIAYAQGTPTFYVADCIWAKKKFAWVNSIYTPDGVFQTFASDRYRKYSKVICVSDSGAEAFSGAFPEHASNVRVIFDINNADMVKRMAGMASPADVAMAGTDFKILTVGRFAVQKGYDIALEACRLLKERGIPFHWYVLGKGALENEIRQSIAEKGIGQQFILLGTDANPYPYFAQADIYVQTSRFEGFGLAIAEARMLNTPVVTTRFDAVYAQMVEGENGLVVDMAPEAVADGIQRLMEDQALYDHIVQYQSQEKKGNKEEIEKFYKLIGE